jgi:nucleoside-diphosphate-sugar epimerase
MHRSFAITGATGFVGKAVMACLAPADVAVRSLVRRPDATVQGRNVSLIAGDLNDEEALEALCDGVDALIHIAGAIAARSAEEFHAINAEATRRLAGIAGRKGVKRFVFVSSLAAREPQLSAYGASKAAADDMLRGLEGAMSVVSVRAPAVYGPGDRATLPLIQQLSRRHGFIPAARGQRLSLVHVGDLAEALVQLASEAAPQGVFELDDGTAGGYDWADLSRIAEAVSGRPVSLHFIPRVAVWLASYVAMGKSAITGTPDILTAGKVRELYHDDWVARNDLLSAHCDWWPRLRFQEGLAGTISWYRAHGWLPPGTPGLTTVEGKERQTHDSQ